MVNPIHLEAILRDALAASTAKAKALETAIRETQNLTPNSVPQGAVRRDLVLQIEELEDTLQYMGAGHPRRRHDVMRLHQLKTLLQRWDQTLEVQHNLPALKKR